MRLEVDEFNVIRIYRADENLPFFEQPCWPDGTPWRSQQEAEEWGQQYLNSIVNPMENPEPPLYASEV